jgi:response regulator NasT
LLKDAIENNQRDALRLRVRELEEEIASLKVSIEDRKVIERAKGILMRTGISEEKAYSRLQQMAQRSNMRLVVVARKVLEVGELFEE